MQTDMCRVRDALLEPPNAEAYRSISEKILQHSAFIGLPHVLVCHGGYGAGKTRLLRGVEVCAERAGHPCTFFNVSQYDPESVDLSRLLVAKMGKQYLKWCGKQELRAKFIGYVAGSLDATLAFAGMGKGILAVKEMIEKTEKEEREQLLGAWANVEDPVEMVKAEFLSMVSQVCWSPAGRNQVRPPWIVFIDDMDRLFPQTALDLLLSLRPVMGNRIAADSSDAPPVLFLAVMNVDCLRDAVRDRFASIASPPSTPSTLKSQNDFVEQFIRKYFLFGPAVPPMTAEDLERALLDSVPPSAELNELTNSIPQIAKLSARSGIPYRTALRSFDRVLLYYVLKKVHEDPAYRSRCETVPLQLFVLEMARHQIESELQEALKSHQDNQGESALEQLQRLRDESDECLARLFSELEKPEFTQYVSDNESWALVFRLAMQDVW